MNAQLDVSVVLSTYNRAAALSEAIAHLAAQTRPLPRYEILIVDNNSTDHTRAVVEEHARHSPTLIRYIFEPRQGLSHARNTGIDAAAAAIVAFTDDDVRVSPGWVQVIRDTFAERADVHCLGGRTLPIWPAPPPIWLTRLHWVGPLALQDYGDTPQIIDARRPLCLAGANLAFRKDTFDHIGRFSPAFLRAQDTELLLRLYRAGYRALYVPKMLIHASIDPERLTKTYHRRWHASVGRCNARMRFEELADPVLGLRPEVPRVRRILGIPTFALRQFVSEIGKCAIDNLRRRHADAFQHENRARALANYMRETRTLATQTVGAPLTATRSEP